MTRSRARALAAAAPKVIFLLFLSHAHADHSRFAREITGRIGYRVAQLDAPWTLTRPAAGRAASA